jgi:hypothetical protein
MAMILEFPETQPPARRRSVQRSKPTAEIILFPGVRYERWAETQGGHEAESSAIVRDRLQLIE